MIARVDALDGIWVQRDDDGRYCELLIDSGGSGWYEYGRGSTVYEIIEFNWRRGAPDRIDLTYTESREIDDDGSVTHGWTPRPSAHTVELETDGTDAEVRPSAVRFTPPLHGITRFERKPPAHRPQP